MVKLIKCLWCRIVVDRYISAGLSWGYAHSFYPACGPCIGYKHMLRKLRKWQRRYKALGYTPIPLEKWVLAGGWGEPYEHLLFLPLMKDL